jgi:hypothetical protein
VVGQGQIIFNEGGLDIDFRVEAVGVTDALQVRGSDGQITLGVLTAGYLSTDAGGVVSATAGTPVIGGGAGSANRVAYWSDANTITSDAGLTVDAANDFYLVANAGGIGNTAATARLTFDSSGATDYANFSGCYVGINEAAPEELLHLTSADSAKPVIFLENTNADTNAPGVYFYKNSVSPADADRLGFLVFYGNDSGGTKTLFAYLQGKSEDITDTDEGGELGFYIIINGTSREILTLNGYNGVVGQDEVVINEVAQDVDFRVEAVGATNALFVQGSDGYVGIGMTPVYTLDVTGNLRCSTGFGCNGKTPQTAYAVNAASTDLATVVALCNQLRGALIANGICV